MCAEYALCLQHDWTILPTCQHEYGSGWLNTTNLRLSGRLVIGKQ